MGFVYASRISWLVLSFVGGLWSPSVIMNTCVLARTVRHHRFLSAFLEEARAAGLDVEKKKANLLPERPDQDGIPTISGRRPVLFLEVRGAGRGG